MQAYIYLLKSRITSDIPGPRFQMVEMWRDG